MKILAALVLNLTWYAFAVGQCIIVLDAKPSAQNAKITVLLDGKPQGKVKLLISLPSAQGFRSLVTDSQGAAPLKGLPVGTSCITATTENNFSGRLCLEVSAQPHSETTLFQVSLSPPRPNPFDEKVKRSEELLPSLRLKTLAGTVFDPAGGVIPKAEIQVFRHGSYPREAVTTLKTDEEGKYSASLEPGVYTVIVRRLGFQPEFHSVEISPNGKDDKLRQILQLKPTDTCDDVT